MNPRVNLQIHRYLGLAVTCIATWVSLQMQSTLVLTTVIPERTIIDTCFDIQCKSCDELQHVRLPLFITLEEEEEEDEEKNKTKNGMMKRKNKRKTEGEG